MHQHDYTNIQTSRVQKRRTVKWYLCVVHISTALAETTFSSGLTLLQALAILAADVLAEVVFEGHVAFQLPASIRSVRDRSAALSVD